MRIAVFLLAFLLPCRLLAGEEQQLVSASRLVEAARKAVQARLSTQAGEVSLTSIGMPEDVRVDRGAIDLKVRPISGKWPRSRIGVPVDVLVAGHVARSATVWFALTVQSRTLTYSEELPVGTAAAAIRPQMADVDVTSIDEVMVGKPEEIDGMRLRRSVRAGEPVLKADFERIPDVDRHQKVRVSVTYGAIRMATHGVANSAGNTGDVIPVLVDSADVPVRAKVTDKGVVEVVQ
jgi:flagella basal body P-ring formation protein FlgA